jgi:hypothetical protein
MFAEDGVSYSRVHFEFDRLFSHDEAELTKCAVVVFPSAMNFKLSVRSAALPWYRWM